MQNIYLQNDKARGIFVLLKIYGVKNNFIPSNYQKSIFEWIQNGQGNAIVEAVAGSGKTTTLLESTKYINSENILFAAFNNHIISDIKKKKPNLQCKTTYSIGFEILKSNFSKAFQTDKFKYRKLSQNSVKKIEKALRSNYSKQFNEWLIEKSFNPNNQEVDEREPLEPPSYDTIQQQFETLLNLIRSTLTDWTNFEDVQNVVSHYGIDLYFDLEILFHDINTIFEIGIGQARENHIIDFIDMVWLPNLWNLTGTTYKWILIDEAQDLNKAQLQIVLKSKSFEGRMIFVGDPRQAIYGFTGADAHSFHKIQESVEAKYFPLSICYRCPNEVIKLAKEIVPHIEASADAKKGTIRNIEEFEIANHIKENDLILCRWTAPLIKLCISLISKKKPAKVKGKDIGLALKNLLLDLSKTQDFQFDDFKGALENFKQKHLVKFKDDIDSKVQIDNFNDKIECVLCCYEAFKPKDIFEFINAVGNLFSDEKTTIWLSTIHKAKGLEEKRVFVLFPEKLPHIWEKQLDWQLEQENNLKYVAFTRSLDTLYLVKQEQTIYEMMLETIVDFDKMRDPEDYL